MAFVMIGQRLKLATRIIDDRPMMSKNEVQNAIVTSLSDHPSKQTGSKFGKFGKISSHLRFQSKQSSKNDRIKFIVTGTGMDSDAQGFR